MADIPLSRINGGSGVFVPTFLSGMVIVSSGASGTFITLTPPSGERVKIEKLVGQGAGSADIQLAIAGSAIITGDIDSNPSGSGDWGISPSAPADVANAQQNGGFMSPVTGGVDEVITVIATGVNTATSTFYAYAFGVIE